MITYRGVAACALVLLATPGLAQELEPRALTNLPVGMSFVVVGYGYGAGSILLDPALPIEDLDSDLHTFVGAYARAISFFGKSAKVDVVTQFAQGDWHGVVANVDSSTSRTGFGDPRFRISVNFVGAPALERSEFVEYRPEVLAGMSIQVIAPFGQYDSSKLINLGSNRWTVRGQIGASRYSGPWIIEGYVGGWFFTENPDFFGGLSRGQKPLWTTKLHLIRATRRGRWIALDVGYGIGGRALIEGQETDTRISAFRFGLTGAIPLAPRHTLRLAVASGARLEKGPDFDAVGISYQYSWGG